MIIRYLKKIAILVLLSGSSAEAREIADFTTSPITPNVLLVVSDDRKRTSVYQSIAGSAEPTCLLEATGEVSYHSPSYLAGEDRVIAIASKTGLKLSRIVQVDPLSKETKTIASFDGYITEARPSTDHAGLWFVAAKEYQANSPIGRKGARGFDIYHMDIKTAKIDKSTNLNAYGISGLSVISTQQIAFRIDAGPDSGIFIYSRSNSSVERIAIKNNPRGDPSLYYSPTYPWKGETAAFIIPYQIYTYGSDGIGRLIFSNPRGADIGKIQWSSDGSELFFTIHGSNSIYALREPFTSANLTSARLVISLEGSRAKTGGGR